MIKLISTGSGGQYPKALTWEFLPMGAQYLVGQGRPLADGILRWARFNRGGVATACYRNRLRSALTVGPNG
jgi:hypothetical protein